VQPGGGLENQHLRLDGQAQFRLAERQGGRTDLLA
jgi:hypothetical protein